MIHVKGQLAKQIKERMGIAGPRKPRKPRGAKRVPKPVTEARSWKFTIPGYLPPSLNHLLRVHWMQRRRMKANAVVCVGVYGRDVPPTLSRRTVIITLERAGRRKEMDADNAGRKVLLDALVTCGLLVDDSPAWCSCPDPIQVRGAACSTTIELLEVPNG